MNISDLDIPMLAEQVRKIAEAEPEMMTECRYFDILTHSPLCIVGHAMALQGMTIEDLRGENGSGFASVIANNGSAPVNLLDTVDWIGKVQYEQDSGLSWEQAVLRADCGA